MQDKKQTINSYSAVISCKKTTFECRKLREMCFCFGESFILLFFLKKQNKTQLLDSENDTFIYQNNEN